MIAYDRENTERLKLLNLIITSRQELQNLEQSLITRQVEFDAEVTELEQKLNRQQKMIYDLEHNLSEIKEQKA